MIDIPRPEYPRPQFVRNDWINLNGEWDFEYDHGKSGRARGMMRAQRYSMKIRVPFCPESELSGIGNTDFMRCVWYRRPFEVPEAWLADDSRILLHIGACDWHTEVWVNEASVGAHQGGYVGFSFDITGQVRRGENALHICAEDDTMRGRQCVGKQSLIYESHECSYTRTTGIWQTVWLERVPAAYIESAKYTAMIEQSSLLVEVFCKNAHGRRAVVTARYGGREVGRAAATVRWNTARIVLPLSELHLWAPGSPELYDLELAMGDDRVESYFGLRDLAIDGKRFRINGKTVFQRLVLDQGYYPDGIYTAPDESALVGDIRRAMDMGFNGARLHMKIFEPRFLYHCDRLGYMVWGESAAMDAELIEDPNCWSAILPEWLEALRRDYNHPAIIGWCAMNEVGGKPNIPLFETLYHATKMFDSSRPVIDDSGHAHHITDIFDTHESGGRPEITAARYAPLKEGRPVTQGACGHIGLDCLPATLSFVSEYGGLAWNPENRQPCFCHEDLPQTEEEFLWRYEGMTRALLENPGLCGFCYIQLNDVEQECNGLHFDDRRPKFDPAAIRAVNALPAAIEQEA